jgi:hypothetical protein
MPRGVKKEYTEHIFKEGPSFNRAESREDENSSKNESAKNSPSEGRSLVSLRDL